MQDLRALVAEIPDFPKPGILFRDIGPLLRDRFAATVAAMDALFTEAGYRAYVDDLMIRMVNPYLRDRVDRIIRDPRRKLGWDDRLVGTMRRVLEAGIEPDRYARGARAALNLLKREHPGQDVRALLIDLWVKDGHAPVTEAERMADRLVK